MANEFFSERQLQIIKRATPKEHIEEKADNKGNKVKYVSGNYVKSVLNELFNYNWQENILKTDFFPSPNACVVAHVRLTGYTDNGLPVIKEQFGGAYVDGNLPYAYKAAATDALKKCAAEIGLFSDVYIEEKPKELPSEPDSPLAVIELLKNECIELQITFTKTDAAFFNRTVQKNDKGNFEKCIQKLKYYISKAQKQ